jgi:Cytochrome P460
MVEKAMQMKERIKFFRKQMRTVILVILAASVAGIVMICLSVSTPMSSFATLPQPSIDVSDLNNRTKWYKVNQVPYSISQQVNELCAAPNPDRIATRQSKNPHDRKAITVYVNQIGTEAMMSAKSMLFPTGAVIVKKKIDPQSRSDAALLYTVMIKHQLDFNPNAGGWEFAVVSGNPPQLQSRGDLASCMECHLQRKQDDYVFRTYR